MEDNKQTEMQPLMNNYLFRASVKMTIIVMVPLNCCLISPECDPSYVIIKIKETSLNIF